MTSFSLVSTFSLRSKTSLIYITIFLAFFVSRNVRTCLDMFYYTTFLLMFCSIPQRMFKLKKKKKKKKKTIKALRQLIPNGSKHFIV